MARYPDVEIPVVSDAIEPRMAEAKKIAAKAEAVLDYRRILDRKDIDMVVIATTQHWHGIPFIHTCQAGKPGVVTFVLLRIKGCRTFPFPS